ncbi:unnamed protein product [Rhizoctonia solani]|uniref:Uncharacterized protein n=3 Tax=Rhizoctonia solani TaxID=456999 RepID=A0A8H3CX10_9AGAM|nr:hypothetical protein RSOL_389510 [Rhizoctonia solani AG-3 Rhs1AP]KEP55053.1 hypothetical protein V565_009300 [Rhizoctonia solani 123E]CAE6501031.1 unnamed protein product [Rhizoctonia solani]
MSDQDGAICGGCCAILCASTLGAWCNLKAFGGGNGRDSCCGGPRGCCHSCFSNEFDEDSWDKKDAENRQREAGSSQPTATPQMNATAPSADNPDTK